MDAHENEYAGAVAAMNHGQRPLPVEGEEVSGTAGGRRFTGIVQNAEPGRIVVEIDGAWLIVRPCDLD